MNDIEYVKKFCYVKLAAHGFEKPIDDPRRDKLYTPMTHHRNMKNPLKTKDPRRN